MTHLVITHRTTYRYAEDVSFGPHRLMLRPRDSHEMGLLSATLTTSLPADLVFGYDIFGNVVCTATFEGTANELEIESRLEIERFPSAVPTQFFTGAGVPFPPPYSEEEIADLGACRVGAGEPLVPPELADWAAEVVDRHGGGSMSLLSGLCHDIHEGFTYETRYEETTRSPQDTFALRSGACRDLAAFFIGVARHLGFGARFVSGYLFDPPQEGMAGLQGAGATHAWAEVYLPGAGWTEFDPTNGLIASDRLIRVAVAREPHQVLPIQGSFVGSPSAFVGLWVGVSVESVPPAEALGAPSAPAADHAAPEAHVEGASADLAA